MKKRVVVGMSGGVDSSVTAWLLKQEGYDVIGMFMKNWEDDDDSACPATADYEDVIRVCKQIGIPHYSINLSKNYWDKVFKVFLEGLKKGTTPNPDILCNREIKFKIFLEKALELGGDYLATGHYCQNLVIDDRHKLVKGVDPNKDQTYFLYTLREDQLKKILFPIGSYTKAQIRKIAEENALATAKKKDSTGICFIGKRKFAPFISKYISNKEGDIEDTDGKIIGKHNGLHLYTIGQRRGINIGGPGEPWFVADKEMKRNVLIVAQGEDNPALFHKSLTATEITWVNDSPKVPFKCKAKIRYRQIDQNCTITSLNQSEIVVEFDKPQRAITPSQSVVFYNGEICLGGAIIKERY